MLAAAHVDDRAAQAQHALAARRARVTTGAVGRGSPPGPGRRRRRAARPATDPAVGSTAGSSRAACRVLRVVLVVVLRAAVAGREVEAPSGPKQELAAVVVVGLVGAGSSARSCGWMDPRLRVGRRARELLDPEVAAVVGVEDEELRRARRSRAPAPPTAGRARRRRSSRRARRRGTASCRTAPSSARASPCPASRR